MADGRKPVLRELGFLGTFAPIDDRRMIVTATSYHSRLKLFEPPSPRW